MRQQTRLQTERQVRPVILTFDDLEALRFSQPEVIIGRSASCDVTLEDKTVSGRHARLAYHHGQWWLEDLASTNGTFLNGDPVGAPVVITHGDQVRCGQVGGGIAMG